MFRLTLKTLAARKMRLFSTALAVFLGVAFMAGTLILTDTMTSTLSTLVVNADAGTDVYVRAVSPLEQGTFAARPRISAETVTTLTSTPGVKAVAARVTGYAQIVDRDGNAVGDPGKGAPTIGGNWITVDALNAYHLAEGRAPKADNEVVIDKQSAKTAHYSVGDHAKVLTKQAPLDVVITGIAKFGTADSMGGVSAVMFNDSAASAVFAKAGQIDGVAIVAANGVTQADLTARISDALPKGQEALTGKQLANEDSKSVTQGLDFFKTFMLVFAGISLLVGGFIIANTFSILVAQRTKELALLRAIGASRKQVRRSVLTESVITGVVASGLGLLAGVGLARGLKALLDSMGFGMPSGPAIVSTGTIVISLVTGTLVTALSAVIPARRAAKVAPVEAMREASTEARKISGAKVIRGLVFMAIGAGALAAGMSSGTIPVVLLGSLVLQTGIVTLSPVFVTALVKVFGWPMRRFGGLQGNLAGENARRNPRRTASTAAALRIGVALVVAITVFAASARSSVSASVRNDLNADYIVDSGAVEMGGMSPHLTEQLAQRPEVATVVSNRITTAMVNGITEEGLNAWSSNMSTLFQLHVTAGTVDLGRNELAVSKHYAELHHLTVGQQVPVEFVSGGESTFTVKGIYDRAVDMVGELFVSNAALETTGIDQLDSRVAVKLNPGVDIEAARSSLEQVTGNYPTAKLLTKSEFIGTVNEEIDQMLNLIYALLALAVFIALIGIANTLALSTHERRRELGLLRAVGMSRRQVRSMVRQEATLISLFGAALGVAIGLLFGWALVESMKSQGVNVLTVPTTQLAVIAAIAVGAGVAASLRPARRAAKLDVLQAVSSI
jgi:putative ABC transport system permease protein